MPELRIQIPDDLDARITAATPNYLDRKGFLCLLIDNSLDSMLTLGLPSAAKEVPLTSSSSSSSNTLTSITNKREVRKAPKPKVKKTKGSPDFESFWKTYQSCAKKANCQSKVKAWECWEQLVPDISPADLISAAQKAVDEVNSLEALGDFCAPLPDAFRWLRDERYVVLLEDHTPARSNKPSYLCY